MDYDKRVFIVGLVAGSVWMMATVLMVWAVFK
jgi:hypothetical protein